MLKSKTLGWVNIGLGFINISMYLALENAPDLMSFIGVFCLTTGLISLVISSDFEV